MAQRVRQQREGLLEAEHDGLVVGRGEFVGARHQRLAECVARAPAPDRGDAVARQHLLAVVEQQPVAQRQLPGLAVVFDDVAGHHLRRGLEAVLLAGLPVQGVVHHVAVVTRHVGGGPHRIEHRQIRLRDELQVHACSPSAPPTAAPGSRPRPQGMSVCALPGLPG